MKIVRFCFPLLLTIAFGCDKDPRVSSIQDSNAIVSSGEVSSCGGYANALNKSFAMNPSQIFFLDTSNCQTQKLYWKRISGDSISFLNTRVGLNCCGERKISAEVNENQKSITLDEWDGPVMVAALDSTGDTTGFFANRCRCACTFDFFVIAQCKSFLYTITINRKVDNKTNVVLSKQIDLSANSGVIILDTSLYCKKNMVSFKYKEYVIEASSPTQQDTNGWFKVTRLDNGETNTVPAVAEINGTYYLPIMSRPPSFNNKVVTGSFEYDSIPGMNSSDTIFKVIKLIRDTISGFPH